MKTIKILVEDSREWRKLKIGTILRVNEPLHQRTNLEQICRNYSYGGYL